METTVTETLFARIGGMNAVDAAVDIFYSKVMMDDRINHFFFHIDMNRQSGKMKAFLAFAFGAPVPYPGLAMREAHQHMHLTEPKPLIDEVVMVAISVKNDVLNT